MEIQNYTEKMKKLQNNLLKFIENSSEYDFQQYLNFIESNEIQNNREEFRQFLLLISKISNNHYRQQGLIKKIENILQYFSEKMKQTFSNSDIFNLFNNNKRILHFLFNQEIITIDEYIINEILEKDDQFRFFFIPEMKQIEEKVPQVKTIEQKLLDINKNAFDNYEEKRQIGENDSYICSLIRQDSIEEFIIYYNKSNISLSNSINSSLFETNSFLENKNPTLIEYAAFYGSIRIFQYLISNGAQLTESLWLYAIHSNNAEVIYMLGENDVKPLDKSFQKCFLESIKCHHNEIANYIQDNLLTSNNPIKVVEYACHYLNFSYFPENFDKNDAFFYLCKYNYFNIVDLILATKKNEFEATIIININFLIEF